MSAREADEIETGWGSPLLRGGIGELMVSKPWTTLIAAACLIGLGISYFGPALFAGRQFAYRDAADFYYPLYQRVQQEWEAGRLPLWEPEENGGVPLLGNPTAAVLYPGKLLYARVPYAWGARLYIVGHVLLAFGATFALLRHWSVSRAGAAVGGLSYAFGGPVVIQYCNAIFLVGAAWMPLGFLAADRWVRLGRRGAIGELALVLAMQVLGGDPEAAYLVALCAAGYAVQLRLAESGAGRRAIAVGGALVLALYALLLGVSRWILVAQVAAASGKGGGAWAPPRAAAPLALWGVILALVIRRWRRRGRTAGLESRLVGLAGACGLALALAGAQLVPVLEFTARSLRASEDGSRDIYLHSLHPLQLAETIAPNVFGTTHRGNHSWLAALPPDNDAGAWVHSLYLGVPAIVLALAAAGFRGRPAWCGWLTAVAIVALLASLGEYGSPLFWARRVPGLEALVGAPDPPEAARVDAALRDGDGGVYWFLASALPGFWSFRYPAKLLIPACLAIAGLAGIGWDRAAGGRASRAAAVALAIAAACLAGLCGTVVARRAVGAFLAARAEMAASAFGPFDTAGAAADLRFALAQGGLAAIAVLAIVIAARRRPVLGGCALLIGLTLDLGIANSWTVFTVPQAVFDATPRALERIREAERANPAPGPFRVYRMMWSPTTWATRGSAERLAEMIRWERDSLRPKALIPYRVDYTYTMGTTELLDYCPFFDARTLTLPEESTRKIGLRPGQGIIYYTRRGFDLWNTRYFVLPARLAWSTVHRGYASFLPNTREVYPPPGAFDGPGGDRRREEWLYREDVQVLYNEAAFPRAWIVHKARFPKPVRDLKIASRAAIMNELLFQDDELWSDGARRVYDPRETAWIEADDPRPIARRLSRAAVGPGERVVVTRNEPQRVELVATLDTPGLVVLADVDYPGWRLAIDGRPAAILRTNRAMRGALVDAGTHRLVYTYEPISLRVGAALSGAGVLAWLALGIWARRRREPVEEVGERGA